MFTYSAIIGRYSLALRGNPTRPTFDLTLILKNVNCHDKLVADHRWINLFYMLPFLSTLPGDEVEFEAETYTYRRKNQTEGWSFRNCKRLVIVVKDEKSLCSPLREPIEEKHRDTLRNAMGEKYEQALTPYLVKGSYARLIRSLVRMIKTPGVASTMRRRERDLRS